MKKQKNIIVVYFNSELDSDIIENFKKNLISYNEINDDVIFFIPSLNIDTFKIECINPKYISRRDIVKQHSKLMNNLNNKLKKILVDGKE